MATLARERPGQSAMGAVHWKGEIDERGNDARVSCMLVASFFMIPAERPSETLPPGKTYRPSGYRAIHRLPYYTQPKQHAAEAICEKTVRILFPNVSILFNFYS